jgi:hypothetical protein
MDLPRKRGHSPLRGARSVFLATVNELRAGDLVRGQVHGYTKEKGVAADSRRREPKLSGLS